MRESNKDEVHPNQRLSLGRSRKNVARRLEVRKLLLERGKDGKPLSFAAIGDRLGIGRERVRQLAQEEVGVRGRTRGGRLRGKRRFFKKEADR